MSDPSPLAEASSASLDELFNKPPPYSVPDRIAMVAELHRLRALHAQAELEGKRTPRATRSTTPKLSLEAAKAITLDDLGL